MSWFKFDYFKSKERQELISKDEFIQEIVDKTVKAIEDKKQAIPQNRPFRNVMVSGDAISVVLHNGDILSKLGIDKAFFDSVVACTDEASLISLFTEKAAPKVQSNIVLETPEEKKMVNDASGIFAGRDDFFLEGGNVYMVGVSLAIPTVIVASFIEILEKQKVVPSQELQDKFIALKMFWLKLALNPIEQSRIDLLNFVRVNNVRITTNGNLVLYRRIVSLKGESKLTKFISKEYYRIKSAKKGPKNYVVVSMDDGTFACVKEDNYVSDSVSKLEGNLKELYHNLHTLEENEFTSAHNRGKFKIKIGSIYQIEDKDINLDNGLCAAGGLHAAAVDYDYSSFGDTPVVVLVSPSKAITVPIYESGKLRTTEMFIAAVNDKPRGVHFDDAALSAFDEEYNNITIEELEEAIKNKSFAPVAIVDEVSPLKFTDLQSIKDMLKKRVNVI